MKASATVKGLLCMGCGLATVIFAAAIVASSYSLAEKLTVAGAIVLVWTALLGWLIHGDEAAPAPREVEIPVKRLGNAAPGAVLAEAEVGNTRVIIRARA